jgi:disulfide bond formation protein DsbB
VVAACSRCNLRKGRKTPAEAGMWALQMQSTRVVRCDEAAWRFLGLSLAGYNVLISLALAAAALWGALGRPASLDAGRQGSSSVSQYR